MNFPENLTAGLIELMSQVDREIFSLSRGRRITATTGFTVTRPSTDQGADHRKTGAAGFAMIVGFCDLAAGIAAAAGIGAFSHFLPREKAAEVFTLLDFSLSVSGLFVLLNLLRNNYSSADWPSYGRSLNWLGRWNIAFFYVLAVSVITGAAGLTGFFASVWVVIFIYYVLAIGVVASARFLLRAALAKTTVGRVLGRRVFAVGYEREIAAFCAGYDSRVAGGMQIVSRAVIRGGSRLREDLAVAVAAARLARPDDILIQVPWVDRHSIDACVDAFRALPAAIHLGPEQALARYSDAHFGKIGPVLSFCLVREPLSPTEIFIKRLFDVAGAVVGGILLAPVFAIIAILIKLESSGPVFFVQRRRGFDQETFRIFKFRTMNSLEDGPVVRQATKDDARVTRVGKWLRRANLDELPQLLNVLRGEMSIVGPRPHALAHDLSFERKIADYARRHNVKPGITGWAQVNGLRGEITTDDDIRNRIRHDLYYVDNWSFWLDMKILVLTVLSAKAYLNAN